MLKIIRNAWSIPELRKKLLFTLLVVVIFRLGSFIPVPFVNLDAIGSLAGLAGSGLFAYLDMFSGGAFSQGTLFAMSISPYINASIIMQLLAVGIPALERLSKEPDGQKKIGQITRYLAVGLGIIQGFGYYTILNRYNLLEVANVFAAIVIIATFSAGAAIIMWLGEQVNEKGIGNGISMILFAGIISRIPSAIVSMVNTFIISEGFNIVNYLLLLLILVVTFAMIVFIVFMTNAERRIPVQYSKKVVGRKMYGGQSSFIPIKVNNTGVMPIIFAGTFLAIPSTIAAFLAQGNGFRAWVENNFAPNSPLYAVIYFILIIAFAFFYIAISVNPVEMANNIKSSGGFVPGIRPGKPTSDFIKKILYRVTVIGALFLGIIAIVPTIISLFSDKLAGFSLGGTSILIVIGVALETVRALESQMLMRHYKGFLE